MVVAIPTPLVVQGNSEQVGGFQCLTVTVNSITAQSDSFWSGYAANNLMIEFDQMHGCHPATMLVVSQYIINLNIRHPTINQDQGDTTGLQRIDVFSAETSRNKNNAIDLFFNQHIDVMVLFIQVVIRVAQDHTISLFEARIFDSTDNFGKIGVSAVW